MSRTPGSAIRALLLLGLSCLLLPEGKASQPGQIIIDPDHPLWLKRQGGEHLFICGPGDPEGFLYRGKENPDGTREGDQMDIIRKLLHYGGNCLYIQAVRSHGGDGTPDHNPFIDHDPGKGVNHAILDQWEEWFTLMDRHGVLIYFFFYDDSSRVWSTGDVVGDPERNFITTIVDSFEHHRNLIWVVAEESEEAFSSARAQSIGSIIAGADDHGHLIGNHHHSGIEFKSHSSKGPFRHFSMQLNVETGNVYQRTLEARGRALTEGYQMIYAENTETAQTPEGWRKHAWSVAMAGAMPMLLGMDVATTPEEALQQCRILSGFFEDTDFYRMSPVDGMTDGSITHLLCHEGGHSFIAYGDGTGTGADPSIRGLTAGKWELLWVDCLTGRRVEREVMVNGETTSIAKPESIGREWACHGSRQKEAAPVTSVTPGPEWQRKSPEEAGFEASGLDRFATVIGGRGCIIHDGFMIHSWGDISRSSDIASAGKPFYSHLLFRALETGRLESADDPVVDFQPCLDGLNPDLDFKDRALSFRHLAFQTASLGYREPPGGGYDYNDFTMGFFWDTMVNKVFETPWPQAKERIFGPGFIQPMDFQDPFHFPEEGRMRGRIRISPRDFARVGILYLNHGKWNGRQLISQRHVRTATTDPLPLTIPRTSGVEAERCDLQSIGGGGNQTDHNGGYSWLWWVNGVARDGGRWWKDAPADMFCALGHCGQRGMAVFPSHNLVLSWNDAREIHCNRQLGNEAFRILLNAKKQ